MQKNIFISVLLSCCLFTTSLWAGEVKGINYVILQNDQIETIQDNSIILVRINNLNNLDKLVHSLMVYSDYEQVSDKQNGLSDSEIVTKRLHALLYSSILQYDFFVWDKQNRFDSSSAEDRAQEIKDAFNNYEYQDLSLNMNKILKRYSTCFKEPITFSTTTTALRTQTDTDGSFEITDIPPGKYVLYAVWNNSHTAICWYIPLFISASETKEVDLSDSNGAILY